jgi:hypothetical protein
MGTHLQAQAATTTATVQPRRTMMTTKTVTGWYTDKALKKHAMMVGYKPFKRSRGWWVREYHSSHAMERHLKGEAGWEASFVDTGSFHTEEEARDYALGNT